MRILIVNGFNMTQQYGKIFEFFRFVIQQFIEAQRDISDTDCEYQIRDRHSLDDFLYEPESSLIRMEYGLKFDSIDIVFIIAAPNSRPWNQNMRKIISLIRMCIKTKKLLYTTSFGAQAVAYLCSTNFSAHVNVTNANGEGCKLVEFPKYTLQALKNGPNEYFLDSTTGDMYLYNKATDEWLPRANTGIHNRRDAQEFQSIGRFVVKSPTYKPKQTILANQNEMLCSIKKQFLHHWLFQGVSTEFPVNLNNQWDIHSITFTNPEKKFTSLAENNTRGPLIIECDNIIATLFELEQKQKDTLKILENFIDNAIKTIRFSNTYNSISITNTKYHSQNKGIDNIELIFSERKYKHGVNPEEMLKKQHKNFILEYRKLLNNAIQETERDKIFHVGFSVKKDRLPDFVKQNNIAEKNFRTSRRKSFQIKKAKFMKQQSQILTGGDDEVLMREIEEEAQKKPLAFQHLQVGSRRMINKPISTPKTPAENDEYYLDTHYKIMNQTTVRRLLHPNLGNEFLGKEKIWVPGFLSQDKKTNNKQKMNKKYYTESLVS